MGESKRTLNLAGAARHNDGGSDGGGTRQTLPEGGLTEENVAELAGLYGKKIGDEAPTEILTKEQIRAALSSAGQQSGAPAADVGGHRFEISPQRDTGKDDESTDEIELPGGGYAGYLKLVGGLAVVGLLLVCCRTEIADVVGWQKFMDDLAEPEKLRPEAFQQMLDQQLDQHPELTSLEKNKGLNEFLQRMRLDLCPDGQINSMQPPDIAMLKGYGFAGMKMFQADCANGDAGKNLVLVMSDTTSVEFRFEGEENAVKISSMVASGGGRCTVDLGEKLLISCPAKDSDMEDFRIYVGEEFCVQKMVVGDKVYTYAMNDGQCVKVDVSGWAEVSETHFKAVEPLKSNKPRKQGDGVKVKGGATEPKVNGDPKGNAVCKVISKHKLLKDVELPPDFESRCSNRLKTVADCQAAANEFCGPDRIGISICRVSVAERCEKIFREINPMLPR